ncbi:MAG TPA: hypothetical protein VF423_00530 [Actinomycetes bacterium]
MIMQNWLGRRKAAGQRHLEWAPIMQEWLSGGDTAGLALGHHARDLDAVRRKPPNHNCMINGVGDGL